MIKFFEWMSEFSLREGILYFILLATVLAILPYTNLIMLFVRHIVQKKELKILHFEYSVAPQQFIGKDKDGREFINLPVDWKKTREKGKIIYNFNYDTEGYFFGWVWFKRSTRIRHSVLWYFKPCRNTSRLLAHYIKADPKYQHIYREWQI